MISLVDKKQFAPPKAPLFNPQDIRDLIFTWKEAWEKEDLKTYISFYDPGFRSRGMNVKAWKNHRKRLNHKYNSIQVDIQDLIIIRGPSQTAKVSFKQNYRADKNQDFGLKKMNLVKKGKHWKIKNEEWLPMDRTSLP